MLSWLERCAAYFIGAAPAHKSTHLTVLLKLPHLSFAMERETWPMLCALEGSVARIWSLHSTTHRQVAYSASPAAAQHMEKGQQSKRPQSLLPGSAELGSQTFKSYP